MKLHPNAKTSPRGRRLLVARVVDEQWAVRSAAEAAGISERTAYKWLERWRSGDHALADRSSRPSRSPTMTASERVAAVVSLRRLWMTAAEIASTLAMPLSTTSLILKRVGLGKRSALIPKAEQRRYVRATAGELLHIDIKKLARIDGAGHRVTGTRKDRPHRRGGRRIGYEYLHVCVDDATRLAYAELLPDETARSATRFLVHALRFFRRHGIHPQSVMTDNGAAYRSHRHALACRLLGLRHIRIRPRRPQTNGKAERFIRTLLDGWAYAAIYATSTERAHALPGWLDYYNRQRPHGSLRHQTPTQRLTNLLGSYT